MRKVIIGFILVGSALLSVYGIGCGGEGAPTEELAASQEAITVIPSSVETRAKTGVVSWELREDAAGESLRVVGMDAEHQRVGELWLHAEFDEEGDVSRVVVDEGSIEDAGRGSGVAERQGALLAALAADAEVGEAVQGSLRSKLKCIWATTRLIAVCGVTIAACIRAEGTETCGVLSLACQSAVKYWRCKCKDKCD